MNLTRNEINQKLSIIYHFSRENDAFPHFFTLFLSLFIDYLILDTVLGALAYALLHLVKRQHPIPIYISSYARIKFISHANSGTVYNLLGKAYTLHRDRAHSLFTFSSSHDIFILSFRLVCARCECMHFKNNVYMFRWDSVEME